MINRTTEVVVIDDVKDEVEPLLNLLNKQGVGLCYYRGTNLGDLPEKPIVGVRLLFLDFVLGTDGQPEKNKISTLMGIVKSVVARDNGPYVIFAWTTHNQPQDDLIGAFKKTIMNDKDFPKPVIIIDLEKNRCVNNLRLIRKRLKEVFNDKNILEVLFHWESNARTALRDVVKLLTEISRPAIVQDESFDDYSSKWNSEIEKRIYKISEMALGENIKEDKKLLIAAQLALTSPFHDCVERRIWGDPGKFKNLTTKIMSHKAESVSTQQIALLNSYFLLMSNDLNEDIQPGNIYHFNSVLPRIKCMTRNCYTNKLRIAKTKIIESFCQKNTSSDDKKKIIKDSVPILIEITPECDYAQNKWKHAKCVLGILWPESFEKSMNKKLGYIFKPLPIICKDKTYILTFNAHYIFSFPFSVFKSVTPVLKAKKELLVDIQHWFASHISRPGKSEF